MCCITELLKQNLPKIPVWSLISEKDVLLLMLPELTTFAIAFCIVYDEHVKDFIKTIRNVNQASRLFQPKHDG